MENKYDDRIVLAVRNIEAMREGMRHFEAERAKAAQREQALQATVAQLVTQVQALQAQVAMMRAQSHGTGATT
jgi:hypothetical protein